jgi:hypothetical protein
MRLPAPALLRSTIRKACLASLPAIAFAVLAGRVFADGPTAPSLDGETIMRRSIIAMEDDWRAEPNYDHCERDDNGETAKTYDIRMIDGSPYQRLVAVDDRAVSAEQARSENEALEREIAKRRGESSAERSQRAGAYEKRHARIHELFRQVPQAFVFTVKGTAALGERTAYLVGATPRPGYVPPTRDARALTGMDADFWVDADSYHWAKIAARVVQPVSIVGLLIRLEPGTTVEFEQAAVDGDVWLATRLTVKSSSRILLLFQHHTYEDDRYFQYRRTSTHAISNCGL